jgi:hypothetical protein
VAARGVDPRDATWAPLDLGVAGGGDWFEGGDPWEVFEGQSGCRNFDLLACVLLFSFLFAREKGVGVWETELQNLEPRPGNASREGIIIFLFLN